MNNEIRWKQRFENFKKAYKKFQMLLEIKERNEWENMALVQAFEFTFELSWKTLKDYLEDSGFSGVLSPKAVIRQAFQSEIIQNGEIWMEGLKKRNETVHTYEEYVFFETTKFIEEKFSLVLEQFYLYFVDEMNRD